MPMQRSTAWLAAAALAALSAHGPAEAVPPAGGAAAPQASRYAAGAMPEKAKRYYALTWGVQDLSAKLVESGSLVRFNYRIIDAKRAAPFQDKSSAPAMIDLRRQVSLVVPTMEKIGPLRQATAAEEGKTYWIAFSNAGGHVKPGDRVSVVIGSVRIEGLIVE
jgi:hypothetical protein